MPADRLRQWCSHKAHWMVMNDVPMRLFDALTTGGIAIMPDSLKHMAIVRELAEHIVF